MGLDDAPMQESPSARYRRGCVAFGDIWSLSPAMVSCLEDARRLAPLDMGILLLGETGTGKNLLAQAIHTASPRVKGIFVAKNTSAIPASLAEDELFGHEPGAFTEAHTRRRGLFEQAHGGTLFLDEISAMSPDVQAKILTAVETKQIQRLGAESKIGCDVRLVCATNASIPEAIASGALREDLYYRLARHTIRVPPLRERPEDMATLVNRFIALDNATYNRSVARASPACMEKLLDHPWPGNLRELRSAIGSAVARCDGTELLPDQVVLGARRVPDADGAPSGEDLSLMSVERRHIRRVLALTGWCISETARVLGISRPTLRAKIAKYRLKRPASAPGPHDPPNPGLGLR